mmetsp:Transcript_12299/g.30877  ORF Transcript_12299/g.30877 Transcript_12299/m.30877 type:complete len:288 (+) Transcript_12299:165-1028(+)
MGSQNQPSTQRDSYPTSHESRSRGSKALRTATLVICVVSCFCQTCTAEAGHPGQPRTCSRESQCPFDKPHCCRGKCVCDEGCDKEATWDCLFKGVCDDAKDICREPDGSQSPERGRRSHTPYTESSTTIAKEVKFQCRGKCMTCPAVKHVSNWMSAQGTGTLQQAFTLLTSNASELSDACTCRTGQFERNVWDCISDTPCTGPCEDSGFGTLVTWNEGHRPLFLFLGSCWMAWGPSIVYCGLVLCSLNFFVVSVFGRPETTEQKKISALEQKIAKLQEQLGVEKDQK